ncbi:MAG: matrixin family metalloprotease, partial [Planctomycetaceae bacterium]|nr:matrixin family metalloprotease [Planctomycetaceae bacterium]
MLGFNSWKQRVRKPNSKRLRLMKLRAPAAIEKLEDRVLLYTTSGNAWPNQQLITISFVPDGTNLGGATSDLISTFNTKFGSADAWQNQILKAAQVWAQQTDINFAVVSDNGAETGSGDYQQGDPGFGDIRIGGFNFGTSSLAQAYLPPPINNYSVAGDIQFNTGAVFNVGTQHDLFTVALHEFGHALALYHSSTATATMYPTYNGIDSALNADDISGIKNIYSANAARKADSYDLAASNGTTSAASVVTPLINTSTKTAVINNLDLTTNTDLDFFKFVVPSGSSTTLKATVVTEGLSLMNPKVEILNSAGTVKATATATATDFDGTSLTATFTGIAAGQT